MGDFAAANLIAVAPRSARTIRGNIAAGDEDFFVLNEKFRDGDTLTFSTSCPCAQLQVRFYVDQPCSFATPSCAFYSTDPDDPAPSGTVPVKLPKGQTKGIIFVGVKLAQGQSSPGKYELRIERQPPLPYPTP